MIRLIRQKISVSKFICLGFNTSRLELITRRERQIMDILFSQGEANVNTIHDHLPNPPAHTAIRTFLKALIAKGYVKRRKIGREHAYSPRAQRMPAGRQAHYVIPSVYVSGACSVGFYGCRRCCGLFKLVKFFQQRFGNHRAIEIADLLKHGIDNHQLLSNAMFDRIKLAHGLDADRVGAKPFASRSDQASFDAAGLAKMDKLSTIVVDGRVDRIDRGFGDGVDGWRG